MLQFPSYKKKQYSQTPALNFSMAKRSLCEWPILRTAVTQIVSSGSFYTYVHIYLKKKNGDEGRNAKLVGAAFQ